MVRKELASAVAALMLLALTFGGVSQVRAAYPGSNGNIVFSSSRAGGATLDLWLMDSSGIILNQLTSSPYADLDATWSPGGHFVAFTRYAASLSDGDIWLINADGTGLKHLTSGSYDDYQAQLVSGRREARLQQ